jgi:hypothetical protein
MLWIVALLVGTYLLARRASLGVEAAVLTAATFGFSGVVLTGVGLVEAPPAATERGPTLAGLLASIDLVSLGLLLVLVGILGAFRRSEAHARDDAPAGWLPGAVGLALAVGGVLAVLRARGASTELALALRPDLRGPAEPLPWLAFPGLAFATVALLRGDGGVRNRRVLTLAGPALLLGGLFATTGDLGRTTSWSGPGAWWLALGALLVALLAGDGLQRSSRAARAGAACALLPCVLLAFAARGLAPLPPGVATGPEEDELVGFVRVPGPGGGELLGWVHEGVPVEELRLRVSSVDARGRLLGERIHPVTRPTTAPEPRASDTPPGARWFEGDVPALEAPVLGRCRLRLELVGAEGELLGARRVALHSLDGFARRLPLLGVVLATLLVLVLPWSARWSPRAAIGLVLLSAVLVARAG